MDHAHGHNAEEKSGWSLPTILALGGAAIVTGIILAPYVAPAIGLGDINVAESSLFSMHNPDFVEGDGLALGLNKIVSYIPFIGTDIAKGGIASILATGIMGIGGVLAGNWISKNHEGKDGIDWGKVIKWGALATSALIALPSILTGVSNGLIYVINELTANGIIDPNATGAPLIDFITKSIGIIPYQEAANMGFTGAAVTLPHLLTCGSAFAPLLASIGIDNFSLSPAQHDSPPPPIPANYSFIAKDKTGKPLPFTDKNHYMTPQEFAMVEEYNSAKPAQKIILKKEFLEKGYDPDFHADGTVHLHKHDLAAHVHAR